MKIIRSIGTQRLDDFISELHATPGDYVPIWYVIDKLEASREKIGTHRIDIGSKDNIWGWGGLDPIPEKELWHD